MVCLQCYLCPGNPRAQGDLNPQYSDTFVFVNDYSAVKEVQADYTPEPSKNDEGATRPTLDTHETELTTRKTSQRPSSRRSPPRASATSSPSPPSTT